MKMFSSLFIAIAIIAFGSLCNAQCMIDLKDEAGMKYKQADTEMNRIYKLATATCDVTAKERLRKAQLAWIKYRDSCCEAEASIYEGGSMYGLAYTICVTDLTKERTGRLRLYDVENSWK
ncbi:MAG: lysozyme inhibitor LprI family protein [Syntrophales bacterium]